MKEELNEQEQSVLESKRIRELNSFALFEEILCLSQKFAISNYNYDKNTYEKTYKQLMECRQEMYERLRNLPL